MVDNITLKFTTTKKTFHNRKNQQIESNINYQHSQLVLTPGTSLGNWALPLKSFNIAALGQHTVHRDTLPGT